MNNLKLKIELLPKGAWGNDFSRTLSKKDWDLLRKTCYERANHKCSICGHITDELDAHEVWDFDMETKTQTLVDIVALCSRCHGVKHLRNSQRLGYSENSKKHFMEVNKCDEFEFANHLTKALLLFEERNKVYRWNIVADLKKFGGEGIQIKKRYIPYVKNPYSQSMLENLKNECDYFPRIIDININNYEGSITVTCDKTNKIIWYNDKSAEIQFNYAFGEKLISKFSVVDLHCHFVSFKLIGEYGEKISKKFYLSSIKV